MQKRYLLFTLILLMILTGCTKDTEVKGDVLQVTFLDVGQGDSTLIVAPTGETMLVDGGTRGAGKNIVAYLREHDITTLDTVVATHPDADHIGGLVPVLENVTVKQFIDSGKAHTSQTYIDVLTLVDEKNMAYSVPKTDDEWQLGDVKINVLHANENAKDNNDASIVLKVTYDEVSYVLTGDASVALERDMLAKDVQATFLKAGHHGSSTSTSDDFVKAVKPSVAILSYGEGNSYGHPEKSVVDILAANDVTTYATATEGVIHTVTDGKNYSVNAEPMQRAASAKAAPVTVAITHKDVIAEEVTITNSSSETVSLAGWQLISVEGNQQYTFDSYELAPNASVTVTSGSEARQGEGYLQWTKKAIWLNAGDAAQLKNAEGKVVNAVD